MQKILISGGPHSGKTTTVNALHEVYPDAFFVPEAAERVIHRENQKAVADPDYTPIHPVTNYPSFAPMVLKEALELESQIPKETKTVFQDRGLIDHLAYAKFNNHEVLVPEITRHIEMANYAFTFFCEQVGEHKQTDIRHESADVATQIHDHLLQAYEESGLEIVHLPAVMPEERIEIIRATVDKYS